MRNLLVYPITHDEAIDALQTSQREFYEKYAGIIGSTRGLCLLYAEQFILANKEAFNEFTQAQIKGTDD